MLEKLGVWVGASISGSDKSTYIPRQVQRFQFCCPKQNGRGMNFTIFIDFDGVIADSIEIFAHAINVSGRSLNQIVNFVPDDLRNIKRMTIPEIVSVAGVDIRLTREFIIGIDDELRRKALEIPIFPGMADVLVQLSKLGPLAVVSASSKPVISKVLANHGLQQHFVDIVGGDTVGSKSSKMLSLIHKYGGNARRACMIGDTVSDIEQSKLANVYSIAVSWGWHRMNRLHTADPDFEINQPAGLVRLVEHLSKYETRTEFTRQNIELLDSQ